MSDHHALLDIVEAAYDLDRPDGEWLASLTHRAHRCLGLDAGLVGYTFDLSKKGKPFDLHSFVFAGMPPEIADTVAPILSSAPRDMLFIYTQSGSGTLSQQLWESPTAPEAARSFYAARFMPGDCLGIVSVNPTGTGVCLTGLLPEPTRLAARTNQRWQRVTTHIGAGLRLRRDLAQRESVEAQLGAGADAVLETDGRLVHAEATAKPANRRAALRAAVKSVDRARGRLRRDDPDEALAIWRGLVSGRWSLIDTFDSDGRRYYVAHQNDPQVRGLTELTRRERQVAALAALGRSDKDIAYELGLARTTIATHLLSARRKLGASSRSELLRLVGTVAGRQGHLDV